MEGFLPDHLNISSRYILHTSIRLVMEKKHISAYINNRGNLRNSYEISLLKTCEITYKPYDSLENKIMLFDYGLML